MGLYEKTRNIVDANLRALLDSGARISEAELKRLILELDEYRRELSKSYAVHANAEAYLCGQIAERHAAAVRWRERRELARERGRLDLAATAEARAEREQAEHERLERQRRGLASAIAGLSVSLEKVDRTLRLLRAQRRREDLGVPTGAGASPSFPAQAQGLVAAEPQAAEPSQPVLAAFGSVDADEIEFLKLEHDEVTRTIGSRRPRSDGSEGRAPEPKAGAEGVLRAKGAAELDASAGFEPARPPPA